MKYLFSGILSLLVLIRPAILPAGELIIYSQNKGFYTEHINKNFESKGDISFQIDDLTDQIIQSSLLFDSDCLEVYSFNFIDNPASNFNILSSYLNDTIRLVKYGDDGMITYSTEGKLLMLNPTPVFEIDGHIAVNPPYDYIFPNIPANITKTPVIQIEGNTKNKNCQLSVSYLSGGFDWSTSYSLTMLDKESANLEAWFQVQNHTRKSFEDINLTLVSGDIKFANSGQSHMPLKRNMAMASFSGEEMDRSYSPEVLKNEDYIRFRIPGEVLLPAKGGKHFLYKAEENVPVIHSYHLAHNVNYRGRGDTNVEDLPVTTRYTISGNGLGEHNHPGGVFRIYEKVKNDNSAVFVGSDTSPIVRKGGDFKLDTGKTHDITAIYTVKNIDSYQHMTNYEVTVIFTNTKNETVSVEFSEIMNRPDWGIRDKSHDYSKKDSRTAVFLVDIDADSKTELTYSFYTENK
ncbi:MAG: hypothetical protein HN729_02295 [Candidatus Marinimicrobia bacterium]|jgi:hypothetical protein|nr:hypothetical protein [Candidatus Neomarinimicrobiota bacterium]MBT3632813.1 hypothetical protein [Candidatus Neomarinimicrobiota bacterium]MBT3681923.1 hypothetical protein [Candidatus Neomarinimicrobiota bacterium]MBT3759048.1 hypothetical protein [Candidatus Neomarinimicrobiota bacterium]MBT3895053.1 hypothetical protein [Candidatus Neomarinimicrobiota bacterium]